MAFVVSFSSWHLLSLVSAACGDVEAREPPPVSPSAPCGTRGSAGPRCCPCWRNTPSLPSPLGIRGYLQPPSNQQQGLIYYPVLWRSSSQAFGQIPCGWHTLCGSKRSQALLNPQWSSKNCLEWLWITPEVHKSIPLWSAHPSGTLAVRLRSGSPGSGLIGVITD